MQEQPKKTYTMEDNIKSIFFQNKDILKMLNELTAQISKLTGNNQQDDGPPF